MTVCEEHCDKMCDCLGFQVDKVGGHCDIIVMDKHTRGTVLDMENEEVEDEGDADGSEDDEDGSEDDESEDDEV